MTALLQVLHSNKFLAGWDEVGRTGSESLYHNLFGEYRPCITKVWKAQFTGLPVKLTLTLGKGPTGFGEKTMENDNQIFEARVKEPAQFALQARPMVVEEAKPDSPWQMTILPGILEEVRMSSE